MRTTTNIPLDYKPTNFLYARKHAQSCHPYGNQKTNNTMTENAPPGSASTAGNDASRGMPYYERLRRDLRESLNKKRLIDNNLVSWPRETPLCTVGLPCAQLQLEDNILRVETQYLEETTAGNIIKGFDNYIKGAATTTTTSGAGTATRRKAQISDADRIFSRSSSSFLRVCR